MEYSQLKNMSCANLSQTRAMMTAACVAHAEKLGWNLQAKDSLGYYTWNKEAWWIAMVGFIMNYEVDEEAIRQWRLFDKMDAGIVQVTSVGTMFSPSLSTGVLFKQYFVNYIGSKRLFR